MCYALLISKDNNIPTVYCGKTHTTHKCNKRGLYGVRIAKRGRLFNMREELNPRQIVLRLFALQGLQLF